MLPGLWPALLLGGGEPFRNVVLQTAPWSGAPGAYSSALAVNFQGGVAPFSFSWTIDNGIDAYLDNPASQFPTAYSTSNAVAGVTCLLTDATGQTIMVGGSIQEI